MLEFNKQRFTTLLLAAPKKEQLLESAEPSTYVQELLDTFEREGKLDLTKIDLNAFELRHVTPLGYESIYNNVSDGWIKGFIRFCRKTPSLRLQQRSFF